MSKRHKNKAEILQEIKDKKAVKNEETLVESHNKPKFININGIEIDFNKVCKLAYNFKRIIYVVLLTGATLSLIVVLLNLLICSLTNELINADILINSSIGVVLSYGLAYSIDKNKRLNNLADQYLKGK